MSCRQQQCPLAAPAHAAPRSAEFLQHLVESMEAARAAAAASAGREPPAGPRRLHGLQLVLVGAMGGCPPVAASDLLCQHWVTLMEGHGGVHSWAAAPELASRAGLAPACWVSALPRLPACPAGDFHQLPPVTRPREERPAQEAAGVALLRALRTAPDGKLTPEDIRQGAGRCVCVCGEG